MAWKGEGFAKERRYRRIAVVRVLRRQTKTSRLVYRLRWRRQRNHTVFAHVRRAPCWNRVLENSISAKTRRTTQPARTPDPTIAHFAMSGFASVPTLLSSVTKRGAWRWPVWSSPIRPVLPRHTNTAGPPNRVATVLAPFARKGVGFVSNFRDWWSGGLCSWPRCVAVVSRAHRQPWVRHTRPPMPERCGTGPIRSPPPNAISEASMRDCGRLDWAPALNVSWAGDAPSSTRGRPS